MGAFLVVCVGIAVLIAGGMVLNLYLYKKLYRGYSWRGERFFYPVSTGYEIDANLGLTNVDPVYSSRGILVSLMLILLVLGMVVIGAVSNVIVR